MVDRHSDAGNQKNENWIILKSKITEIFGARKISKEP